MTATLETSPFRPARPPEAAPREQRGLSLRVIALGLLLTALAPGATLAANVSGGRLTYPETRRQDVVNYYHGKPVIDPYRWLEDDNSPETKAWVEEQNKVTFGYLNQVPQRQAIHDRLTQLWNYERFNIPFKRGDRYFISRNDGLQNQSVLYSMRSLTAEPEVLLDPNKLSSDGTVALSGIAISDDGKRLAYGLSSAGSDWQEWKVRDVESGQDLSDHLKWIKFSGASWTQDGKGFFYSRYDEPKAGDQLKGANYFHKLYFHRLGSPQSDDVLVYERPDRKDWLFRGAVTDDDRYLVISVRQGTETRNRVFYKDLREPNKPVVELLNDFDASYDFIDNVGTLFWFLTDLKASRGRVIGIDVAKPARDNWLELIPEARETLRSVSVVNHQFIADYLRDAYSLIKIFTTNGEFVRKVDLPGIGSVGGFDGKQTDHETFYSFTSFTVPGVIYRYDMVTDASTVFRAPKVAFRPEDYETQQIFYLSEDGTRVPMFITHKKGLRLDGNNPTYLYGYGGFNLSLPPSFSIPLVVWMEMGGVYAMPNLRGGGEYGEDWHQAGTKAKKQNVFDDFIAAAEWLIANKYTNPKKLAIAGRSNGGLLVGACMTQRPELFGAALPAVGVMDMLRFHKFTIGWAWVSDFGSADIADEFPALFAYSPLHHNLKPGTRYPPTLVTTADHDDRVVPAHSFKFAAALQAAHVGEAPVLIRIETRAGHGAGKPISKLIDEWADIWAFLVRELRMPTAR